MIKTIIMAGAFALMAALPACTTDRAAADLQTAETSLKVCTTATAALKIAIQFQSSIPDSQWATVVKASNVINPICSMGAPPTLDSATHAALNVALGEVAGALVTVKQ